MIRHVTEIASRNAASHFSLQAASIGALYAECSPSDAAVTIQFEDFAPGNEAVRLVNHTSELPIDYGQL